MEIVDSVAAVFCHAGSIFTVRRQTHLAAFPGYDTVPGGKIDPEDSEACHASLLLCDLDGRQMHALVREVREELGYSLPAAIASGEVTAVQQLATALAPDLIPIRFRLHYVRIDLTERPRFVSNAEEIAATCWETPRQLLDRFRAGNALMVPPFRRIVERLQAEPNGAGFGDVSPRYDEEHFIPRFEPLSGIGLLPVPSKTFPPVRRTNAFLLGDEGAPRILVDPSPRGPEVMEKLLRTIEDVELAAILITHHHPDHHQHAPELAGRLQVPIWMSATTRELLLDKYGNDYLAGVEVETRREGDVVTAWKGEVVRIVELPGHDAGQLGLAPESLRWFLVGDLIQHVGTVVIAAPEGDMADYFDTLERVIALDPAVIIPSHGMPMRGTDFLRSTLRHRRSRERLILDLHREGRTEDEMLEHIYRGKEWHLLPLARENIRAHLAKLRRDGAI